MREKYRTVFVSDLHLCSKDCKIDEFVDFIKTIKCDKLYIIGDFFDIWLLKKRWLWSSEYNHLIQKLLKLSRKGTEVIYIPGNHDEIFRDYVDHSFGGVKILLNDIHQTVDGKTYFVTHGDEFDAIVKYNKWLAVVGSYAYDYLLFFNRSINWTRRLFGLHPWSLAAYAKKKVKNAEIYISRFQEAVTQEAVSRETTGVICGHIHTPTLCEISGKTYCNTGDWVENCSFVVEELDGTIRVVMWTDEKKFWKSKDLTDLTDDEDVVVSER